MIEFDPRDVQLRLREIKNSLPDKNIRDRINSIMRMQNISKVDKKTSRMFEFLYLNKNKDLNEEEKNKLINNLDAVIESL